MKHAKLIAILLVLVLLFSMVTACGSSKESDKPADTTPSGDSAKPDEGKKDDAAPADTTPAEPSGDADGTIGYITDPVNMDRDPYKIAYLCGSLNWVFNRTISDFFKALAPKFNVEYTEYDCNNDFDAYINQISTFANNGYDAVVLGTDDALCSRAVEVAHDEGMVAIGESTALKDFDGVTQAPSVVQDQYGNGYLTMQWLADNYKNYWSEDISGSDKVGLIGLTFSGVTGIQERIPGMCDAFAEAFPASKDNWFEGDLVSLGAGFSVDSAYQLTSTFITTNPQIEKWFVIACVDDWATGATRAVEAAKMEDKVLVSCVQGDAFVNEMNGGYSGNVWVSCCYVPALTFAQYMMAGAVAILDGRATTETLGPEWKEAGDVAATMKVQGTMLTKDDYAAFVAAQVVE
ncbi:MAG: substrate-binding domain-containing protein [Oscillospiraceae bacterium]|nr:substrate-binding domain-containing protein [Oscillospiraceae bacterium]